MFSFGNGRFSGIHISILIKSGFVHLSPYYEVKTLIRADNASYGTHGASVGVCGYEGSQHLESNNCDCRVIAVKVRSKQEVSSHPQRI